MEEVSVNVGASELVTLMPAVASIADVRDVDNVLEQCVRALLERVESLEKGVSELRQGDEKRRQEQLRFDNRVVDGLAELHLGQRNTDKDVELLNSDVQTALDMIKDLLDQSEAKSGKSVVKKRAKVCEVHLSDRSSVCSSQPEHDFVTLNCEHQAGNISSSLKMLGNKQS